MPRHPAAPLTTKRDCLSPLCIEVVEKSVAFEQSLDPTRPVELLTDERLAKTQGSLLYRYTDTGQQVSVPNVWYNQTRAMRLQYWQWLLKDLAEKLAKAQRELAQLGELGASSLQAQKRHLALFIESQTALLKTCQTRYAEIQAGGPLH